MGDEQSKYEYEELIGTEARAKAALGDPVILDFVEKVAQSLDTCISKCETKELALQFYETRRNLPEQVSEGVEEVLALREEAACWID